MLASTKKLEAGASKQLARRLLWLYVCRISRECRCSYQAALPPRLLSLSIPLFAPPRLLLLLEVLLPQVSTLEPDHLVNFLARVIEPKLAQSSTCFLSSFLLVSLSLL